MYAKFKFYIIETDAIRLIFYLAH